MRTHISDRIQKYKRAHGLTYAQLGLLFGCSDTHLRKLGSGGLKSLSVKLARRMERATRGELLAVELLLPPQPARRRRA
jgi:hypothetical protein